MKQGRNLIRCQECTTPVFEFRNGMFILKARHDGSQHTTVLTLEQLEALIREHRESLQEHAA